jgi:hypothetical protein
MGRPDDRSLPFFINLATMVGKHTANSPPALENPPAMKTYEVRLKTGLTGYIPADRYAEKEGWLHFHSGESARPVATYPRASVARVQEFSPAFDGSDAFYEGSKFDD